MKRRAITSTLFIAISLLLCCCNPYKKEIPTGTPYTATNVYANPQYNFAQLHNLLILPIDNALREPLVEEYESRIVASILRNFGKFNYFNVQYDKDLNVLAPIIDLDTDRIDKLKLGIIGKEHNAQGALQVSVSDLRTFPPMRAHVKAAIVDVNTGEKVWVFDQVYDMENANVINGMRVWWNALMAGGDPSSRFQVMMMQPSFFTNFVFYNMARSYEAAQLDNSRAIAQEKEHQNSLKETIRKIQKKL
ncbi:hypothetical protein JYU14_04825 [Simkania negevensis]|uniref:Lipoprotein n=1 Tax=Simkania negevensis TaxID=83561 RepID=A0ABS3AUX3_9BACT|nr:hypothetical protein [Simkania negevensis]